MDERERIECIDTLENRNKMVEKVADEITETYGEDYCKRPYAVEFLNTQSLYKLIFLDIDFADVEICDYYINLCADKFANCAFGNVIKDENGRIFFHDLFDYITPNELAELYKGNNSELFGSVSNDMVEYGVTHNIDIKAETPSTFHLYVDFEVNTHYHYNNAELAQRFKNRVAYRWTEATLEHLNIIKNSGQPYMVHAIIRIDGFDSYPKPVAEDMLKFRFGSTSGRPWYACSITNIEVVKDDEVQD